jgi:hypothetical protein
MNKKKKKKMRKQRERKVGKFEERYTVKNYIYIYILILNSYKKIIILDY